ncbi:type II secretion system protein [Planctomycetota bacterium]
MKRKGFTLVELLVVIAIIALLMGILMPALARVRQIAYRLMCGTNLSGIGRAMLVYANDNDERYQIAGCRDGQWSTIGNIQDYAAPLRTEAFGCGRSGGGYATITSSFYLLVKYADVTPAQFLCKGDQGSYEFDISDYAPSGNPSMTLEESWDFGNEPYKHCSFAYNMPYIWAGSGAGRGYPVTQVSNPQCPVASDKNPFMDAAAADFMNEGGQYLGYQTFVTVRDEGDGRWIFVDPDYSLDPLDDEPYGNSASHQREGQNVLFADQHVSFEGHPNVGLQKDNIWTNWGAGNYTRPISNIDLQKGLPIGYPTIGDSGPLSEDDAFLVNECSDSLVGPW